ncbi:LytTR family two component transcriptional regulator [Anaerobacterium chartisolvens]|uniref:Stage 0 sporulation protein A homolog n=1 Tax=Anaerobacterium chartisolvens TaxID=1297424 RepID=A0A369APQ6_9FIRM|nr:LytTR family DNA-binding domain-containing protein [Anaerobacterium chartisolvens]RCX11359.1 LytTR family two component transcriptional regulator [Anaerobacterium chartisolvens]
MIKFITVDQDSLCLEHLKNVLKGFDNVKLIGSYQNPLPALNEIQGLNPHVLISDILMSEMNGLEFAEKAASILPNIYIVFLTEYDKFALKAFELGAFDYIMKPATAKRLSKLILRVSANINMRKKDDIKPLRPVSNHFKNYITVNKSDSIVLINKEEILYCCASNKKTHVFVEDGCFECRYTLEQLEGILEPFFLRCHRGYLVNVQFVREISPMFNQTYIIRLKNSRAEIPVSRNYAIKIREFLSF